MFRRLSRVFLLALVLGSARPEPTQAQDPAAQSGGSRVAFSLAAGTFVQGPSSVIYLTTRTSAQFDAGVMDSLGNFTEPYGAAMILERTRMVQTLRDTLHMDVNVLMLLGKNSTSSKYSYGILLKDDLGIVRDGRDMPALGITNDLIIHPGQVGYTYLVFPTMQFCDTDSLYIQFNGPR